MKKVLFAIIAVCFGYPTTGQQSKPKQGISISTQYHQEYVLDGYVQVREWKLEGDKMGLKELGMTGYPVLHLQVCKTFKKGNYFSFIYEQHFMKGNSYFNDEIVYNGTIIDGTKGVDVSPTRFFRLKFNYYGNILKNKPWELQYMVGLVYDYTIFYLDGEVMPSSPRQEVFESFGKQALPYPEIGMSGSYLFHKNNTLKMDVSGTYIPEFKSFFNEGGSMYLHYSTFLADMSYTRKLNPWEFVLGAKLRKVHLFGESMEDTNDLKMTIAAPYMGIAFWF